MRALTLWQPMAWAISDFTKRIENRPWKPPWPRFRLAIHAGKTYHEEHAEQIEDVFGVDVPGRRDVPLGAVVAVALIESIVTASADPWFSGPYGWVLADVRKVAVPVPCRGAQGLWELPRSVDVEVRRQVGL